MLTKHSYTYYYVLSESYGSLLQRPTAITSMCCSSQDSKGGIASLSLSWVQIFLSSTARGHFLVAQLLSLRLFYEFRI